MKGTLYKNKTTGEWRVKQTTTIPLLGLATVTDLRLHPEDVNQIQQDAVMFDNIEARIAAYPEVDFEVTTIAVGSAEWDVVDEDVAVLSKNILALANS